MRPAPRSSEPAAQFLRVMRLVVLWLAASILLFAVQALATQGLHTRRYATPSAPFESVLSPSAAANGGGTAASARLGTDAARGAKAPVGAQIRVWLADAGRLYQQILSVWWYSGGS
ncbi:MAG: hypothetical protein K6T78_06385 [Alicyclobacillus sp.]|nr:hypothetical protein [Alicyclobacillus sp.]